MTQTPDKLAQTVVAVTPDEATATHLESLLCGAGHNIRIDWLREAGTLADHIRAQSPALVCCRVRDPNDPQLSSCLRAGRSLPVIVLTEADGDERAELMGAGAADVVDPHDTGHLTRVFDRELRNVGLQARIEELRARLVQAETQLDAARSGGGAARAVLREGFHASVNAGYAELFGFADPEELTDVPLLDLVAPDNRSEVEQALIRCRRQGVEETALDFDGQRADDSRMPLSMHLRPIEKDGRTQVEITVSRAVRVDKTATPAGLLAGRRSLYRVLDAVTPGAARGLLCLRVDDLAGLQDRVGLRNADQVLDELAAFLLEALEAGARCFRLGLAEFAVLTTAAGGEAQESAAHSLRRAVDAEIFGDESVSAPLTVSIAATELDGGSGDEGRLLKAQRLALELSDEGGDQVATLTAASGGAEQAPEREGGDQEWRDRLRGAVAQERIALAYQTVASLEGDRKEHYDVLPRLVLDEDKAIPLRDLDDAAARQELMPTIDRWVVARLLRMQAERADPPAMLAPLSAETLADGEAFLDWLGPQCDQAGVDPDGLLFAIDEADVESNIKRAQGLAESLRALGFGLVLARFGVSSKSAQVLEHLAVDFVRLDGGLTASLGSDENPRLARVVEAARKHGVKIIAERVRDAHSMARLWQLGVGYIQSRFVQEPGGEPQPPGGMDAA